MTEGVDIHMNVLADDAKLLKRVGKEEDCTLLKEDLDNVWQWSTKWEMEFNTCKLH